MPGIYDQVLAYIDQPDASDFDDLALAVFAHQYAANRPYRAFCESRGAAPSSLSSWRQIPAVPIQAFKEVDLCCGEAERVFLSTGTTAGADKRSRHCMPDLRLYRRSAVAGLRRFLFPDVERMKMVSLIPPVTAWPDSSLAQMVAWAGEDFSSDGITYATDGEAPRVEMVVDCLRDSERSAEPLAIFATTAALIQFLDYARQEGLTFRLPHDSRLMDTGGGKGAPRPMSRKGILHAVWNAFAIPGYFAVNEYGMAEMSSQYYDSVICDRYRGIFAARRLLAPEWLRTCVLDPVDLEPVADGEAGLLCHYDLANAGSVMAILSEDMGRITGGGLQHLGRAPQAEARGCSLAAGEWKSAAPAASA